jgi:hypothetical protein
VHEHEALPLDTSDPAPLEYDTSIVLVDLCKFFTPPFQEFEGPGESLVSEIPVAKKLRTEEGLEYHDPVIHRMSGSSS